MNSLAQAQKIVEELEDQFGAEAADTAPPGADDMAIDVPPPSEEPISDEAVGADTEGNVVIGLLSDIRDLLAQVVGVEGEPGDDMPPGAGGPPGEGEPGEEEAIDAIPEPPDEGEDEDDDDDDVPGHKIRPTED